MSKHNEQFLKEVSLFRTLDRRQLERLANSITERTYTAGESIVKENDAANALYLIVEGQVRVHKGGTDLNTLGAGDYFGEMALLDEFPRSASVTADEQTRCLLLPRWDFIATLRSEPEIALAMLPILSERIRAAESRAYD